MMVFAAASGAAVQEEMWGSGADDAGEEFRVGEAASECKWLCQWRRPNTLVYINSFSVVVQESSETSNGRRPDDCSSSNLEDALIRLEEEQQRYG